VPAPKFFLQELQRICRQHGIMLIVDEVQSAWDAPESGGRSNMRASSRTLSPARGNRQRHAVGRDYCESSVMNWKPGSHGTTFGGNPVCLAASLATMDLLEGGMMENARKMGEYIFAGTKGLDW